MENWVGNFSAQSLLQAWSVLFGIGCAIMLSSRPELSLAARIAFASGGVCFWLYGVIGTVSAAEQPMTLRLIVSFITGGFSAALTVWLFALATYPEGGPPAPPSNPHDPTSSSPSTGGVGRNYENGTNIIVNGNNNIVGASPNNSKINSDGLQNYNNRGNESCKQTAIKIERSKNTVIENNDFGGVGCVADLKNIDNIMIRKNKIVGPEKQDNK